MTNPTCQTLNAPLSLWDEFRLALGFLTRLPAGTPVQAGPGDFARSMRLFPVIGAGLGLVAAAVFFAAGLVLPVWCAAALAVLAGIWLTGALHEDGLADIADGFGGGRDVAAKLEIMRDSRVGTYGIVAVLGSMILRIGAIAALPLSWPALAALVAAYAASRAVFPVVMSFLEPARKDGLGAAAGWPDLGVTVWAVTLGGLSLIVAYGAAAPLVFLAAAAAAFVVARLARAQIGGYTGDVLGASQQAVEIALLLVAAGVLGK